MEVLYEGIDKEGKKRKGKLSAPDINTAYRLLLAEGIRPIKLQEEKKSIWQREIIKRRPSDEELSFVLIQLSLLLSSGLPLTKALEVLQTQVEDSKIYNALASIKEAIEKGDTIPLAFKKAEIFPEFLVEMLKVVERGENLEKVFQIAGEFLQSMSEVRSKVISSLTYPAFVLLMSFMSVVIVIKFVVPKVASVLASFGKELPLMTQILLFISKLIGYLFYALPLLLIGGILLRKYISREKLSYLFLKLPIFGKVSYYFNLSRFAGSLHMAITSGIPLVKALSLSRGSMTNFYMRRSLEGAEEELYKGKSLSEILESSGIFPPLFINLIKTGERSGELERILKLLEEITSRQAMRVISFWVRIAEPLSMLLIGILVAFIVLSVILPITEISTGVRR